MASAGSTRNNAGFSLCKWGKANHGHHSIKPDGGDTPRNAKSRMDIKKDPKALIAGVGDDVWGLRPQTPPGEFLPGPRNHRWFGCVGSCFI